MLEGVAIQNQKTLKLTMVNEELSTRVESFYTVSVELSFKVQSSNPTFKAVFVFYTVSVS